MSARSPPGHSLDVKKSSYKKLSKFLNAMEQRGLVVVKELSKGVESIVSINYEHDEYAVSPYTDYSASLAVWRFCPTLCGCRSSCSRHSLDKCCQWSMTGRIKKSANRSWQTKQISETMSYTLRNI